MKSEIIEYFCNYKYYGYEGVGHCNTEYWSENIEDVINFVNSLEFRNNYIKNENGHIVSFNTAIYRRHITTQVDYLTPSDIEVELRNKKIENIIN